MTEIEQALATGVRCHQAGDYQRAENACREILRIDPNHPRALHLLGLVAFQTNRSEFAVQLMTQAARFNPTDASCCRNLALALHSMGRFGAAIDSFRQALQGVPANADPREVARLRNEMGISLAMLGRFPEAERNFRTAIELDPRFPEALSNLGSCLNDQNRTDQGLSFFEAAVQLDPQAARIWFAWGMALAKLGRLDDATEKLRTARAIAPGALDAHKALGLVLREQGRVAESISVFRDCLDAHPESAETRSDFLLTLNCEPSIAPSELFAEHLEWNLRHGVEYIAERSFPNDRDPGRRLKVGYVSPDFRKHPVGNFVEAILRHHRRDRVEVYCFSDVVRPDAMTATLEAAADHWRPIRGMSDPQAGELIASDGIDLLVDLAGHTPGNRLRLFAKKPAPILVTYLGYPNTTGLDSVDYRLVDAMLEPDTASPLQTEKLFWLPTTFGCYSPPADAPDVAPAPIASNGWVTFGSLNNLSKFNHGVFDLWAEVLRTVPESRLLLLRHTLQGSARDWVARSLLERGIGADRLELRSAARRGLGYLGEYADIDIALDTTPFTGHTTTCEALWMGVPVITLLGSKSAARMSASVLRALGYPEWIAETSADYVAVARRLAADPTKLANVRTRLRERMRQSELCDGPRFTMGLETAYREMWRRWLGFGQ